MGRGLRRDGHADVVIVGGAAVGSAIAYFLGREGFKGRIVVVEKDPSYQWCATGRSVASIRQQFSTPENIRLSQFGWRYFSDIKDEFGPEADVALVHRGYAIMASAEAAGVLRANVELQRSLGADVELLGPAALKAQFPWLAVDDLAGAGWGRSGEGWVDPHAHLQLMRKRAIAQGVTYLADEVVGVDVDGGTIAGVRLASGGTDCDANGRVRGGLAFAQGCRDGGDRSAGAAEEALRVRRRLPDAASGRRLDDRSERRLFPARGAILSGRRRAAR